jgi:tetratricopeptide (TPR) repeat protein
MEGEAAILGGEYDQAHAPLRRVIAGDSLGLSSRAARCLACEAFSALVTSYVEEDSLPAALGVAAEWTRLEPTAGLPWRYLAAILGQRGRVEQGFAALRVADSLNPGDPAAWRSVAGLFLMGGRFTEATELARVHMKTGPPSERSEARRLLTIAYRQQGRLHEALEVARAYRNSDMGPTSPGAAPSTALLEAQVLMEQGHFGEAAVLFDSIGRNSVAPEDSAAAARTRVWTWALMATALAPARDTIRFAGLVDSALQRGQLSAYALDRRMHYYIRGLLERARGHHEEAVAAFRAAIVSPTMGFTRINYALAGEYLTLNRPAEAVATLQSAQRGSFDGSNLYLTHTDLMERLAQAFESAGERDSAAVYYARIAEAWQNSDPAFTPRHYEARYKAMRMLEKH